MFTYYHFVNSDSFSCASNALKGGASPSQVGVLNMASWYRPGGGYLNGASAQEEDLCRQSNLYAHIMSLPYPMSKTGGFFTNGVIVFRNDNYFLLDEKDWWKVGIISVAAVKDPELKPDGSYVLPMQEALMVRKIKTILRIALWNNIKTVILGAFGCGAYHNPPYIIAKHFYNILHLEEFRNQFEHVWFAILDKGDGNFDAWTGVWDLLCKEDDRSRYLEIIRPIGSSDSTSPTPPQSSSISAPSVPSTLDSRVITLQKEKSSTPTWGTKRKESQLQLFSSNGLLGLKPPSTDFRTNRHERQMQLFSSNRLPGLKPTKIQKLSERTASSSSITVEASLPKLEKENKTTIEQDFDPEVQKKEKRNFQRWIAQENRELVRTNPSLKARRGQSIVYNKVEKWLG